MKKFLIIATIIIACFSKSYSQDSTSNHKHKFSKGVNTLDIKAGLSNTKNGFNYSLTLNHFYSDRVYLKISAGGESGKHKNINFNSEILDAGAGITIVRIADRVFLSGFSILSLGRDDLKNFESDKAYNTGNFKFGFGVGAELDIYVLNNLAITASYTERYLNEGFYSHRQFSSFGVKYRFD